VALWPSCAIVWDMVTSGDGEGLDHKARHNQENSLGVGVRGDYLIGSSLPLSSNNASLADYLRLFIQGTRPVEGQNDLIAQKFRKWRVPGQHAHAKAVRVRLAKIWPSLSEYERADFLETAEAIADAEKAKRAWNPKANRARYQRLCRNALDAARLAREISSMFPAPWDGERTPIGDLIAGLVDLVNGSLEATFSTKDEKIRHACHKLKITRQRLSDKKLGTNWELIRDLVWLASEQQADPDERSVRRYLQKPPRTKNPGARKYWKPYWGLILGVNQLPIETRRESGFEKAARSYLDSPASAVRTNKAAQKRR